jgi:hypothetical protein
MIPLVPGTISPVPESPIESDPLIPMITQDFPHIPDIVSPEVFFVHVKNVGSCDFPKIYISSLTKNGRIKCVLGDTGKIDPVERAMIEYSVLTHLDRSVVRRKFSFPSILSVVLT